MRWSAVVVGCVALVACTSCSGSVATDDASVSLSQARQVALARLDEMRYGDVSSARKLVQEADSIIEVDAALEAGEAEEAAAKVRYWSCAGQAVTVLRGSRWETSVSNPDSQVVSAVELMLHVDGAASLEVRNSEDERVLDSLAGEDAQVAGRVGRVTAWKSDAEELVKEQRWIGKESSASYQGPKACDFPFNLTLTVGGVEEIVDAKLRLGKRRVLFVLGSGFSQKIEG